MPTYQCNNCGCVENTATGWYHQCNMKRYRNNPNYNKPICSACAPTEYDDGSPTRMGKWHNSFRRMFLPKGEWVMNKETGSIKHKDTGETDYMPYVSKTEYPD